MRYENTDPPQSVYILPLPGQRREVSSKGRDSIVPAATRLHLGRTDQHRTERNETSSFSLKSAAREVLTVLNMFISVMRSNESQAAYVPAQIFAEAIFGDARLLSLPLTQAQNLGTFEANLMVLMVVAHLPSPFGPMRLRASVCVSPFHQITKFLTILRR